MTLTELRSKFPPTRDTVYVNHAATAPLSTPVMEAVQSYLADRHRTNIENYHSFAPLVESARSRISHMIRASADCVEFAPNTSYALNVLAQGLRWREGDRVAVPAGGFPEEIDHVISLIQIFEGG